MSDIVIATGFRDEYAWNICPERKSNSNQSINQIIFNFS